MKKLLAILLAVVAVVGLFAGCTQTGTSGNGNDPTIKYNDKGKQIINIGIPENLNCTDYENNAYTLWLEEQTGYDLQFQLFASSSGDYKTQLSVQVLNEKDTLPDILMTFNGLGDTTWKKYGKEGYFISLTEYFEDKEGAGKAYWDAVEASGIDESFVNDVLRRCKGDDGEIYAFPCIESTPIDTIDYQVSINQEWLDYLNLDMPTDPDSLYKVLVAFRDGDPNQNGLADEIPLIGSTNGQMSGDIVNWIVNMFVYFDDWNWFNLSDDGKTVVVPFTSDAYRQAMIYMNKLYNEGLMNFGLAQSEIKNMVNSSECTVGIVVGHPTLTFTANKDTIDPYVSMPIWGYAVRKENTHREANFITEDAADVDACWELLCLMCTKEGSYRQRYGEKGVDWDDADEGATSFLGLPAEIKILNDSAFAETGAQCWKAIAAALLPNAENESVQVDETTNEWSLKKFALLKGNYEYFTAAEKNNPKYIMPHIVRTTEENEETYNERSNCQNAVSSYRVKFIKGELDPNKDADWQVYLKELETQGLQTWIEQTQELYEQDYMEDVLSGAYVKY